MKKQDLTAPKIKALLMGKPMADARRIVETELGINISHKLDYTDYLVDYFISDRNCHIKCLRVGSDRTNGNVVTVYARYS